MKERCQTCGRNMKTALMMSECTNGKGIGSSKATRPNMKTGIGALVAGIVGVIGILLFLIAFGTEYWLLATEACAEHTSQNATLDTEMKDVHHNSSRGVLTFYHEGFFWRCWFSGEGPHGDIWKYWFERESVDFGMLGNILVKSLWSLSGRWTGREKRSIGNYYNDPVNQPRSKYCHPGYLFPMPIAMEPLPNPSYDPTAVYRGFWTVFIMLGITSSLVGVFLLVCGSPFVNARLYKYGGIFLLISGGFFLFLLLLFVLWKEFAVDIKKYILLEKSEKCISQNAPVDVHYGWSFMFAASGTPLVCFSGLLFYLIGQKNIEAPK
ncbi:transmembrane protein 182-like isoform X2 [Macrotis lagotis]|uniref:transmembrane protein 182-like isoform X2 n=1 Tax=Macrotis lagotis TaxID=92651 RepID=UPI003D6948D5